MLQVTMLQNRANSPERSGTALNDEPWHFLTQAMAVSGENDGSLCLKC
jgi:hypothetical protein